MATKIKKKQNHLNNSKIPVGVKLYFCLMEISDALIDKLAMLSRLQFNEIEKREIKSDLKKMIGFIDKLKELDTDGIAPQLHITNNVNLLREDIVVQNTVRESALQNAPVHGPQFFKVPKVIKK